VRATTIPVLLALFVTASILGCASPQEQANDADRDTSDNLARTPPRDTSAPMSTASVVTLRDDGRGYTATFPYTYTNRSGDSVYLVNCNGDVSPALQRRVGDRWEDWWIPATNGCLSPPVVIAPGGTYHDTAGVHISSQDGRFFTELTSAEPGTKYRLVWHQALASFDAKHTGGSFGRALAIEHRVSNEFELRTQ
jgi:hypothetical protein